MQNEKTKNVVLMWQYVLIGLLFATFSYASTVEAPNKSLKSIYQSGQIEFIKELEISRDSLPEDAPLKRFGRFEVWKERVYIVDTALSNIKVFDLNGKFQKTFGQSGKGPGDLYYPSLLCPAGNELLVWEMGNFRFSAFRRSGTFISNRKIRRETGRVTSIKRMANGQFIVERDLSGMVKGTFLQYFGLELYSKDFTFIKVLLKEPVSKYSYIMTPERRGINHPFAAGVYWDVLPGNRVVIGYSKNYKLLIMAPVTGKSKTVYGKYSPVTVSEIDKELFFNSIVSSKNGRRERGADKITRMNTKFPKSKPAFRSLTTDYEGNILVVLNEKVNEDKQHMISTGFDAYDKEGGYLNYVTIKEPEAIYLSYVVSTEKNAFWLGAITEDNEGCIAKYHAQ